MFAAMRIDEERENRFVDGASERGMRTSEEYAARLRRPETWRRLAVVW
jgi:hypothetical protein